MNWYSGEYQSSGIASVKDKSVQKMLTKVFDGSNLNTIFTKGILLMFGRKYHHTYTVYSTMNITDGYGYIVVCKNAAY